NSMWQLSSNMAGFATRFCLIDSVGYSADRLSASVGNAIVNNGLVTVIVVAGLGLVLWRTAKGAGSLKAMLRPLGVIALMGIFIAGASGSTPSTPGVGSPWWMTAKINN